MSVGRSALEHIHDLGETSLSYLKIRICAPCSFHENKGYPQPHAVEQPGVYFALRHPHILFMTTWQRTPPREPPKTKAELREMLTEAVRNTQSEAERRPKEKKDRG